MNPLFLGPVLEAGKLLISRFLPDPSTAREAERELLRMVLEGDLKTVLAQLEINAREAAHPSLWVSGWRPFFGWAGGSGFLYSVLLHPLLSWLAASRGWPVPPPIDTDTLLIVAGGMLGIGGLRTIEKSKGVS